MDVLIIRPGALGDTLLMLPSIIRLSGKFDISFVGRRPGIDFVKDHVYHSSDLDGPGWFKLFHEYVEGDDLPIRRTDLAIAFFKDKDGRILNNLKWFYKDVPVYVFNSFPEKKSRKHVGQYLAECLKEAGLDAEPECLIREVTLKAPLRGHCFDVKRDCLVIHPGSGSAGKNHPPEFWIKFLKRLGEDECLMRLKKIIILGPAEEQIIHCFESNMMESGVETVIMPGKSQIIRILCGAAVYLGHDSGITHLASLLGTPVIAFFKSSNIDQWRPLGPKVRTLVNSKPEDRLIEEALSEARCFVCKTG